MKTKIKDISTIQTGLFAKPSDKGDAVYLQSKHFDEKGILRTILYPDLNIDNITKKHILRSGDVLFSAKGTKNFAAIFESDKMAAVASTSFFVIRISNKNILPEYLVWFLNHPYTQSILKSNAKGTAILSIRKTVLDDLEISVPPVEKQKLIVRLSNLANKEVDLRLQITNLKKQFIEQNLLNEINNN